MEKATVLAFDIGTSSIKASVFDGEGAILCSASHAYPTRYGDDGRAEQDPEDWWRGLCVLTQALREKHLAHLRAVAVIGVGGHMLSCVPVDARGQALHPCLIHADARAYRQCLQIAEAVGEERIYRMSGNRLDPRAALCKLKWFQEREPEVYLRAERFLHCKDFVVARLTGDVDTTDFSDSAHSAMSDVNGRCYDKDLYRALGLDMDKLPTLRRGTDVAGRLTSQAAVQLGLCAGIPVIAGAGDGPSATLGVGAVQPGDAYLCLGTTAWIGMLANEPCLDAGRRIFSIPMADGERLSIIGTMQTACAALNWAMHLLGVEDPAEADSLAKRAMPGSEGMLFLPYLEGERSPIFDHQARGVFFGLSSTHDRAHMLRATLEGVGFALRSILDAFRDHADIRRLRIIGGGAKSVLWREILTDQFGLPIDVPNISAGDVTAAGIAMAAGLAVGLFSAPEEAARRVRVVESVYPNQERQSIYADTYRTFSQLYPRLKDLMVQR